jgi:hypothetical protein
VKWGGHPTSEPVGYKKMCKRIVIAGVVGYVRPFWPAYKLLGFTAVFFAH